MPYLAEISYSEEECITAIRDYYQFLTTLYLDEAHVVEPPEGGWPSITVETFAPMEKTDGVVSLLRQLPYIRPPGNSSSQFMAAPWCWMADWDRLCRQLREGRSNAKGLKGMSQNLNNVGIEWDLQDEAVPAHVIGLTFGGRDVSTMLLDTKEGAVYWIGCPTRIAGQWDCTDPDMINDDAMDYPEDPNHEWRSFPAWPVASFFEMLKRQYVELSFIPLGSRTVGDVSDLEAHDPPEDDVGSEGAVELLQTIYRRHGWPDSDRYNKEECLAAVIQALEGRYPLLVDK